MLDLFYQEGESFFTTSLIISKKLGSKHSSVMDLIRKLRVELELLGSLFFIKDDHLSKYYILNERQAFFLLTCMRSNDQVIAYRILFIKECFEKKSLNEDV